jgi:dTDP-4-amino-4,6-dideoxygalactose transaminase
MESIPFNRPFIVGKELFYIARAVLEGQLAGNGVFTRKCETWMQQRFEARRVLLTHSCTAALEMCALLTDVGPGDEVVVPSYTFVSTANAFALRGARIRFIDVRPDTLNLDETKLEEAITPRTRVVVPVHYAGVSCEMETIMEIARARGVVVVEDAAQGVRSLYRGRYLGTIGDLGTYSFHETKNYISGEGGALVVNREDYLARAEILRSKGTNRGQFERGEVDRYSWVDLGSSYEPSEIVAAFLYAQLQAADEIAEERQRVFRRYAEALADLEQHDLLRLPVTPAGCEHTGHMFHILMPTAEARNELIAYLRQEGIHSVFHYVPLHSSPMGRKVRASDHELPVTDDISARLVRIPCYFGLSEGDQDRVIDAIVAFVRRSS